MASINATTKSAKEADIVRKWYVVDASDQVLGRLSSAIAIRLRGKHKAMYTPHCDTGDYIIVLNASKIRLTGRKLTDKIYHRHTGYPGGVKSITLQEQMKKDPRRIIEWAVTRMLPHRTPLGRQMLKKLRVYADQHHDHEAQQPIRLIFNPQTFTFEPDSSTA